MSAIDRHEWNLLRGTTRYRTIDGSVDIDDEWSPLTQARLTVIDDDADPILAGALTEFYLELYQSVGPELQHTRDLTTEFGGGTTADITAAWGGLTIAEIDGLYDRSWGSNTSIGPSGRRASVRVTELAEQLEGTLAVTVESQEASLVVANASASYELAATSVSKTFDLFAAAEGQEFFEPSFPDLTRIHDGLVPPGMAEAFPNEARVPFEPGDNILEALQSTMLAAGLRVVDFGGGMCLVRDDWTNPTSISIDDATSVIAAPRTLDLRQNADLYLIVYSETKTKSSVPYYGVSGGTDYEPIGSDMKTKAVLRFDSPAPWPSSAQADIRAVLDPLVDRLKTRRATTQVQAVARYDAFPRATVSVGWDGDTLTGIARRVTFRLSERSMTIDLREVAVS